MNFVKSINIRVGKMRKDDECVVYPNPIDSVALVQGSRLIMKVDLETGNAIANYSHGSSYPNVCHLMAGVKGRKAVIIPPEKLAEIKNAIPQSGDYIGSTICQVA